MILSTDIYYLFRVFPWQNPPTGVSCWPKSEGSVEELEGCITGPEDSPYAKGHFKLNIRVPERYPFEPPQIHFETKIYHPNIDTSGRICLDILKVQPSVIIDYFLYL